ncbi:three-Cys-motif partner protein TcmP [Mucilaginibacter galii]|nr:three-Cys-motif partner protein TcmP [Mucilaginibacter galii]
MNKFGGNWTEAKMEIVVNYAKAYLRIMNKQSWAKTLYFDGFAGSGLIGVNEDDEAIKGTALRILDIVEPKPFDMYYFVELDINKKISLENRVNTDYFGRNAHVVQDDCNKKIVDMAGFLKKDSAYRALAFIDPYGMTVNWSSIEALKGLGIDLWILVPTGLGVNRLLKNNGDIEEGWLLKLEKFLGLPRDYILNHFYKEKSRFTLFGEEKTISKEDNVIEKIGQLYTERLKTVFKAVSESFVMRNSNNSIMYHFMMATNNPAALTIANDVVKPKYKL